MKKMKLQMLGLSVNDLLSQEEMKKVMGGSGSGSGNCPPNTYACICTDIHGNIGPDLDAYGTNIEEAAFNASNYCSSIGWAGSNCSVNWAC
jgi:hypothetical protein